MVRRPPDTQRDHGITEQCPVESKVLQGIRVTTSLPTVRANHGSMNTFDGENVLSLATPRAGPTMERRRPRASDLPVWKAALFPCAEEQPEGTAPLPPSPRWAGAAPHPSSQLPTAARRTRGARRHAPGRAEAGAATAVPAPGRPPVGARQRPGQHGRTLEPATYTSPPGHATWPRMSRPAGGESGGCPLR